MLFIRTIKIIIFVGYKFHLIYSSIKYIIQPLLSYHTQKIGLELIPTVNLEEINA
mgnify:CR=1 FL=1